MLYILYCCLALFYTAKYHFLDYRNRSLLAYLKDFGVSIEDWCTKLICGSVDFKTVYVGAQQAKAVLVSRLSCERAGTRYNVKGIDDEGNVANFVETEQVEKLVDFSLHLIE